MAVRTKTILWSWSCDLGLVALVLDLVLVLRIWSCLHHWYKLQFCTFIFAVLVLFSVSYNQDHAHSGKFLIQRQEEARFDSCTDRRNLKGTALAGE